MTKIPILLYHDLVSSDCSNEKTNIATRDTVIDVDKFEQQIKFLAECGYQSLSLKDFFKAKTTNQLISLKSIIITFDDGHYSNYHLAFPVLQKYGFKGVFFVIAKRIDQPYHLTRFQIMEMAKNGMEIYSHGLTHNYLPLLKEVEVEKELVESKSIIEGILGDKVDFFAYPGGHYSRKILNALKKAGYRGACSCLLGLNDYNTKPFLFKRIEVRGRTELADFKCILNPGYILFYQCVDFIKGSFRKVIGLKAYTYFRSRLYKFYFLKR